MGDEASHYKLDMGQHVTGDHEPMLKKSRVHNNGNVFSSYDRDNDSISERDCADLFLSGFWFGDCFSLNPNGVYRNTKEGSNEFYGDGIIWETWTKSWRESLAEIKMMVRRKAK